MHKIALKKPKKGEVVGSCKRPHISFTQNPWNYTGLEDQFYGTGFQTCYYPEFDKFFCVLDIDDYKNSDFDIVSAVPGELWKTHTVKTQSGGIHLYLMSPTPLEIKHNVDVPLDLKAQSKQNYNNGGVGHLVVANYCYKINNRGEIETKKYTHDNKPIIEYDINKAVTEIYEGLDVPVVRMGEYTNKSYIGVGNYQLRGEKTNDFHKAIALYLKQLQDDWAENVYYWGYGLGHQLYGSLWNKEEAECVGKALMSIVPYPDYKKDAWIQNFVNGFRNQDNFVRCTCFGGKRLNKQQILHCRMELNKKLRIKPEEFYETFKNVELNIYINLARSVKRWNGNTNQ